MERVNKIINHKKYREALLKTYLWEMDRKYCKHGLEHFLDVARMAYIINLEENLNIEKEIIYAIGLLHDIARYKQYEEGIPHEKASAELAAEILQDLEFSSGEKEQILDAIRSHRKLGEDNNRLNSLIYQADKRSRCCFACQVADCCDWFEEKKNQSITC